ncbi:MAG: GNAT family N-acetyltransferase, partial [Oxalobacteraceae bacterium]
PASIIRWDALAQWASCPNPFFESWYLLPALETFDVPGEVSLVRVEADGVLAGLLPLIRTPRYYRHRLPHWAGWAHGNSFLGAPLIARGLEKPVWRALLNWADEHARGTLFLHLAQLPLEGPLADALRSILAEDRRPAALVHREERALLASPLSPDAYLEAALSGKKRKELRRQHNRLSELGDLAFERRSDTAGLDEWIDAFLQLEASGWKGTSGHALLNETRTRGLFGTALRGAAGRGRLERLTLALDGAPIAMLANFITPPGAFSFKTACDEQYSRFSPGVLLQRENLALLDRTNIDWTDSCASADHPMIDHFWRERRAIGRVSIGIGGPVRRALFRLIALAEMRGSSRDIA